MQLQNFLQSHNISREDFAATIGVSPMAVWRYLNGQRKPSDDIMKVIFEVTHGLVDANSFHGLVQTQDKRRSHTKPERDVNSISG